MSLAVNDRLEAALSVIVVQLAYEQLKPVGAPVLTLSSFIFYGCLQAAVGRAGRGLQRQVLLRCQVVLVGVLGCVFLACMQISPTEAGPRSTLFLVPKLAAVSCVLVFLSILLHKVRGQYNLVSISLFVFSDSIQGLLESAQDSLLVPVVAAVVCTAAPWLTRQLDARVPGLSVLCRALFMATVNWLLDLVQDTSATPGGHCAMLLLLTVVIEVCKSVDPALDETQAYAIYRVTAVLAAYLRRLRVESGIVAVCGLFALLVTRRLQTRWSLAGLAAQILVLVVVSAIVAEFKASIAPLPAANKGMALAALLVSFEAAKLASAP
jgi:hypothetical protein